MFVLWTYEIRDTVFWAVTGVLDIAFLLWLRRTSVRSDADSEHRDRRPGAEAHPPTSDYPPRSRAEPRGSGPNTAMNQSKRKGC